MIHNLISRFTTYFINLVAYNRNSLKLLPSTTSELRKVIAGLRKEGQICDIPSTVSSICDDLVSRKLSDLLKLCIKQGELSTFLKQGRGTPIHKKGPKKVFEKCRPISVRSNIGENFEKLSHPRLKELFTEN